MPAEARCLPDLAVGVVQKVDPFDRGTTGNADHDPVHHVTGSGSRDEFWVLTRFTDVFGVGATGDELIAPRQYMVRFGLDF